MIKKTAVSRLQGLARVMSEKGIDVYLATKTSDIAWLTGFTRVFDEEQAHLVMIDPRAFVDGDLDKSRGKIFLFTDKRYSGALSKLNIEGVWDIRDEDKPRFAYVVQQLTNSLKSRAEELQGHSRTLRIGIESELRLDWYRALSKAISELVLPDELCRLKLELAEMPSLLLEQRGVKDEHEICALKAAQSIADASFEHILGCLKPGVSEKQIAFELEYSMRKLGADAVAFAPIVASGANSAIPHAKPSGKLLKSGDLVLIDMGVRLEEYCSDMTRTVVLGKADELQKRMYAATLEAQRAAIKALTPGAAGSLAQKEAERVIAEHGFEGKLIHSVGHGVGIDIHELPVLSSKTTSVLQEGNIVTVEPGVYIKGVGGVRIEDFGLITDTGFESFGKTTHELIEIP